MTAINLFTQDGSAFMLTDGAFTDFDGLLLAIGNKVLGLPAQGIAICLTGFSMGDLNAADPVSLSHGQLADALIAAGMSAHTTHQDALALLPAALESHHRQNQRDFADLPDADERSSLLMAIAAWDPVDEMAKAYIAGTEALSPEHPPYALARVHNYMTSPSHGVGVDQILGQIGKRQSDLGSPWTFNARQDGLALLSAQREIRGAPCGADYHSIGGRAYLTEVSAAGVTIEEFHAWHEDRIGQPINPARAV